MKHALPVTITLFLLFIISQTLGLLILTEQLRRADVTVDEVTGIREATLNDGIERPQFDRPLDVVFYIVGAILVGTILLLIIIKLQKKLLWKVWFFMAVCLTMTLALKVFYSWELAFLVALSITALKFYRPNIIVHNITEVVLYSGIAVLLVPLFKGDLLYAAILLIIIAAYDFVAVFKSKHMVSMAKFQSTANVFAGLSIPYSTETGNPVMGSLKPIEDGPDDEADTGDIPEPLTEVVEVERSVLKTAILGGGDIAFPLIYSGVLMWSLFSKHSLALPITFGAGLAVSLCAGIALLALLSWGKKDRFYPAMPFISAGCFVGTGIVFLIV